MKPKEELALSMKQSQREDYLVMAAFKTPAAVSHIHTSNAVVLFNGSDERVRADNYSPGETIVCARADNYCNSEVDGGECGWHGSR